MNRRAISTTGAPAAIGPYAQAVASGDVLFCSGQVALDPATGELHAPGDVRAQTRMAMSNIAAVLAAAGCDFGDVVKTTIFLVAMTDFAAVNEVYGEFVASAPPARSTVAVAALPRGASVEIEVIARLRQPV